MNRRFLGIGVIASPLLASAFLGGCATLTTGNSQTITVQTEPLGAVCTFRREGDVIGVINPTPGTLSVKKHHQDIEVTCTKDGYVDERGTVGSRFQAMTFGNILFGGLIGVVVDAASGAATEYDAAVTIVMVPARFGSESERDAFFEQRRTRFLAESKKVKERIAQLCNTDCDRQLRDADLAEAAGLVRLEEQRRTARVGPA